MPTHASQFLPLAGFAVLAGAQAWADQSIETETARPLERGVFDLGIAGEHQWSTDGREFATPIALEYGLFDGTELLVEPVFFTRVASRGSRTVQGLGDTEFTVTQLIRRERAGSPAPAFAIAGEVKLPTARRREIGTGKADYTLYAVASKQVDRFDFHANVGYTFIGSPSGESLDNIWDFALAAEMALTAEWSVFAEVLHNTSTGAGEGDAAGSTTPEAAGLETSGTLGVKVRLPRATEVFVAGVYDNNDAILARIGMNFRF